MYSAGTALAVIILGKYITLNVFAILLLHCGTSTFGVGTIEDQPINQAKL